MRINKKEIQIICPVAGSNTEFNRFNDHKILVDPHTAVAIGVANKISPKGNTVILSTAHPSKFSDIVMQEVGKKPELPKNLENIFKKKEVYEKIPKDLQKVKDYILEKV